MLIFKSIGRKVYKTPNSIGANFKFANNKELSMSYLLFNYIKFYLICQDIFLVAEAGVEPAIFGL